MKQQMLESEKEKYIHSDYHEELLLERYGNIQKLQTAIELGDADQALRLFRHAWSNIHTVNQLYTPKEENMKVLHNQLVSMNTFCMVCAFKAKPNPIYFHTISRHYDTMIEKVASQEQADTLISDMLEDYCSLSIYSDQKQYSSIVQKAIWYITANSARKLNLDQLSQTLGISPSSLSRKFHSETGKTFSQYQTAFRIRTAQRYLQEGGYSITQVAYQVGFTDTSYFSKVFTKYTGTTPSDYISRFSYQLPNAKAAE